MSWEFAKVIPQVEIFSCFINAIQDDCNKRERSPSLITITQCLSQKFLSQPLSLIAMINAKPGQNSDGQEPTR